MKRRFSKAIAIVMTAAMVISTAMPVFADTSAQRFPDIAGHWAQGDLTKMVERGIMGGYPDGTMKPQQSVTIAESIKLINKSLKLEGSGNTSLINYTDVKKDAWYSAEVAIAIENGYLAKVAPGDKLNPSSAATREQLSSMFAQAMKLKAEDEKSLDKFKDANQISSMLKSDMAAAVEKGLFGGYEDNTLRPKTPVVRATMAAVANRTIADMETSKNQGIKLGEKDILIEKNGETISGKELDTVWISPLEGTGTITLENIIAKKVVIMGKESSVVIKADKAQSTQSRRARVGNGESKIGIIEYKAPNSKLDVQSNCTVDELKVGKEAKGSTVLGNGVVKKATISADNFKLGTVGTEFKVESGVDGVTVGGTSAPANTNGTSKSSGYDKTVVPGGGGGGGGGGSSDVIITGTGYSYNSTQKALTVTGSSVTIDSSKLGGATSISTLNITGNDVTISGVTVTGATTVSPLSAPQGRAFDSKALVMPVRAQNPGVTFTDCTLANVTMNRTGLVIAINGTSSAGTITISQPANLNFANNVTVSTVVSQAETTIGGAVTITTMEIKAPGITVTITNGTVTSIVVDPIAARVQVELSAGVTVTTVTANAEMDITGTGTITNLVANVENVGTTITPTNPTTGTGSGSVTPVKNYAFIASNGTTKVNITERNYKVTEKMTFTVADEVYSEISNLSSTTIDEHIDTAMPTVKKILGLKASNNQSYAAILSEKIQASTSTSLKVFKKGTAVAGYVSDIAAGTGNVDDNVTNLTKELLKVTLDDMLSDLAILFPTESIPSKISVQVIDSNGNLVELSNKTISQAKTSINSSLGLVELQTASDASAYGKEVIKISLDNAQTTLSLNIKVMS